MAKGQKSQIVTKKHLARQQRERLQNRYILIVSIAVIAVVVGLIGYGLIQTYVIQPGQPVAKVADKVVTTKQFQTYARYERIQWIQQYAYYQQLEQIFGTCVVLTGGLSALRRQARNLALQWERGLKKRRLVVSCSLTDMERDS